MQDERQNNIHYVLQQFDSYANPENSKAKIMQEIRETLPFTPENFITVVMADFQRVEETGNISDFLRETDTLTKDYVNQYLQERYQLSPKEIKQFIKNPDAFFNDMGKKGLPEEIVRAGQMYVDSLSNDSSNVVKAFDGLPYIDWCLAATEKVIFNFVNPAINLAAKAAHERDNTIDAGKVVIELGKLAKDMRANQEMLIHPEEHRGHSPFQKLAATLYSNISSNIEKEERLMSAQQAVLPSADNKEVRNPLFNAELPDAARGKMAKKVVKNPLYNAELPEAARGKMAKTIVGNPLYLGDKAVPNAVRGMMADVRELRVFRDVLNQVTDQLAEIKSNIHEEGFQTQHIEALTEMMDKLVDSYAKTGIADNQHLLAGGSDRISALVEEMSKMVKDHDYVSEQRNDFILAAGEFSKAEAKCRGVLPKVENEVQQEQQVSAKK